MTVNTCEEKIAYYIIIADVHDNENGVHTSFLIHARQSMVILTLYKAHVLPMLDYACIVWDPHLRKDQLLLKSVQHFALKIASRSRNFGLPDSPTGDRTSNSLQHLSLFMAFCIALVVIFFINNLPTKNPRTNELNLSMLIPKNQVTLFVNYSYNSFFDFRSSGNI